MKSETNTPSELEQELESIDRLMRWASWLLFSLTAACLGALFVWVYQWIGGGR